VFFCLISLNAFACSCFNSPETLIKEFSRYDAIFLATSENVLKSSGDWTTAFYKTKMDVHKVCKGDAVTVSEFIKTDIESNSCGGRPPEIGNEFLVFAYLNDNGLYSTGGCSTFIDLTRWNKDLQSPSEEEKEDWKEVINEIWAALSEPKVVFNK
jgi:hypothetical protein